MGRESPALFRKENVLNEHETKHITLMTVLDDLRMLLLCAPLYMLYSPLSNQSLITHKSEK